MDTYNHVIVNTEECKGCRLCAEACPKECYKIGSSINTLGYQYIEFTPGKCLACGICFFTYPELGAITVIKKDKKAV